MKSKKVLTILLSMAIMLTFMPTMAFAAGDSVHATPRSHSTSLNEELSTPASCDAYGVDAYKCDGVGLRGTDGHRVRDEHGDLLTIDCNYVENDLVGKSHHYAQTKLSKEAFFEAYVSANPSVSENAIKAFYSNTAGKCYVYVDQCTDCGAYDRNDLAEAFSGEGAWQDHVMPADTPDCAETFVCEVCKNEVVNTDAEDHVWLEPAEFVTTSCGDGTVENPEDPEGVRGVYVYQHECKYCHKVEEYPDHVVGTAEHIKHTGLPTPAFNSTKEIEDAAKAAGLDKEAFKPYYIKVKVANGPEGEKWFEPNTFDTTKNGPTCTEDSEAGYGMLVFKCSDCGEVQTYEGPDGTDEDGVAKKTCKVAKTGHSTKEVKVPATCTEDGKIWAVCKDCGTIVKTTKDTSAKKTGHSYKVSVLRDPSVYDDGITVIECENCGKMATNRTDSGLSDYGWEFDEGNDWVVINTKYDTYKGKALGDWYFVGFDHEFLNKRVNNGDIDLTAGFFSDDAIKIADWNQLDAHYGEYEDMQEANCYLPLLQARKDSVSGDWDVHSVKVIGEALGHDIMTVTVDPTCGEYGYSVDTCKRCKEEVGDRYDFVDPVVAEGAECTEFEVYVAKEATPDEDGIEQIRCKVCKKVVAEAPIKYDTAAAEQAAKDEALKAAAPVINDAKAKVAAGNLTDASAKAINDAMAALDTAMKSGGSAKLITEKTDALKTAVANAKTKAASKLAASAKKIKASKKKTKKFSAAKAFTVSGNAGAVSYKKVSGNKKIKVASNGKVTVKKGLKKGKTYKVKVNVTDAGNGTTMGATQQVVLKVKIKK